MKKLFIMLAAVLLASSCEKINLNEELPDGGNEVEKPSEVKSKAFTFHVKGDFQTIQEDMTRAAVRLEENNTASITDLWVFDYVEGVCVQQKHQSSTDADFGHPQMNLTYGEHNIKFVASKGVTPSVTASGISWTKVMDTFCLDYPVTVSASSNGNRAPELKRCITCLTIENTDAIPANAKEIQITMTNRYGMLTLPSLAGSGESVFTNTLAFQTGDAGTTGLKMNTYSLCPSESFKVDVRVKVIGKDNSTISEFEVDDVELKMNRKTVLKGECFDRSNGFSVSVDDEWETSSTVEF